MDATIYMFFLRTDLTAKDNNKLYSPGCYNSFVE